MGKFPDRVWRIFERKADPTMGQLARLAESVGMRLSIKIKPRAPFNALRDVPRRPFSKNPEAERLVGLRSERHGPTTVFIDEPCELGYHCPVCVYPLIVGGDYDERLTWSEYEGFLWCAVCNRDYPSCLCRPGDPEQATRTYLATVGDAIERFRRNLP